MKKMLSLLLALTMLLSLASTALAEPVTITYATFSASGAQEETLKKMVEVFEGKNPDIKIDVQLIGYNDYFTALATKVAGGNAPDVFEMNMENYLSYMLRGTTADLSDLGIAKENYSQGTLDAVSNDGKLYAVPMSFSTCMMFYNKDLFDKAGIAYPTDDWTWADAQTAAEAIVAAGGEDIWGYSQPITYNEFYKSIVGNGGSLLNADFTQFTVNSPENVAVLDAMLARVRGENNVMPTAEQMAGRGDWDLFCEGKLGMIITGIWAFATFTEKCAFDWDIVVEPGFKDKATFFFANVNCISPDSEKKEAAAKFADAMGSDPDIVQLRLDASWELPTIADQSKLSQYIEITPPANRAAVFASMDYVVAPPALAESGAASEIVNNVLSTLEMNDMTAQEALDEIQAQLDEANLIK
ncbi:MAG: sugar ABC transporter substrate-binding protein [Eubacteriales bacterium]|jgi:multiple sugar transport system substrate-binding protein|nr:sugar ABC transporter substrate-binding protein [Eubacteriales bacterium]MDD4105234.1 sugar ABC transporter substrate-binding protein [Eubacteriales bacterium]NLO15224.1 sugar ABC transporter substrate-binding protein [Clostridiales bacterium]